jgi:RNA polymerase sigma-70 factor (ECF subfamily)
MTEERTFESVVDTFYTPLYQFAFSLTRAEEDAADLTQETFYIWARKGHQLRDPSKVKTWLFTTMYHQFLEKRRRKARFPHHELTEVEHELPSISPERTSQLDAGLLLDSLSRIDEAFQAPISLFYLQDYSYKDIAQILKIPLGTVKSRISRGIAHLQELILNEPATAGLARRTDRE